MLKETENYAPKPWELSAVMVTQWEQKGQLLIPNTQVVVEPARLDQVEQIVALVQDNKALVGVSTHEKAEATIMGFVEDGRGLVALDGETVVSFQGMGLWPFGYCELRSARTAPEYGGKGINTIMKKLMIKIASERYGWPFIGFTEAASGSRDILRKLGFVEMAMSQVPIQLAEACPGVSEFHDGVDQCFLRCGGSCGCKVFLLDILRGMYGH